MLKTELGQIRDLDTSALEAQRVELEKELFDLKMKQKTMQLNDTSLFKKARHKIAFINMLLTQRSISES
jgi:ribosomal protein L29